MVRLVQNSFFGGQLDFEMMGRQDYQRYAKGATRLCNFNVMKRGGLDKRRGFDRILDLVATFGASHGVTANTRFRAIPYAYKKSHGFVLLMSAKKCLVVGTNPNNIFQYFDVEGLDGVYSDSDIQELDYQQCGDIIYIAHPHHPPAQIEHTLVDGTHGFHYSKLEMSARSTGTPSITASLMTRLSVSNNSAASVFVEKYKASAVFDGVETLPCKEYFNNSPGTPSSDGDGGTKDVTSRATTAYRAPWTQSQKITLTIKPIRKANSDGLLVWPEEIRIYKKAFNYYGLIGTIPISETYNIANSLAAKKSDNSSFTFATHANSGSEATNTFGLTTDAMVEAMTDYADGRRCFSWPGSEAVDVGTGETTFEHDDLCFNMSSATTFKSGTTAVRTFLGGVYYTTTQTDGENTSVTFTFTGYPAMKVGARPVEFKNNAYTNKGNGWQWVTVAAAEPKTKTVAREDGETEADFNARWADEYEDFVASIESRTYFDIAFENAGFKYFKMVIRNPSGGAGASQQLTFGGMAVYTIKSDITETFDDTNITPDASVTPYELNDTGVPVMSRPGDYPSSVSLSQQRLIWASSENDPERIWMSEIGDFGSYEVHEIMTPSDAIDFMLPVTRFAKVNHICEMRKLLMFNSACEWLVDSASNIQGLTYETIQAYPQSYSGSSARLKPIICNNSLIFCERTGQSVRRFAYDLSNDGFAGRDVSILSSSIFEFNSIIDWTYQQFPYSTLWCAMRDGSLASFEYMEEQDIMAWLTHSLGGGGKCICIATSYAVSPALDEVTNPEEYEYATHEEIFAVVKRQGSLWLERMRPRAKAPTNNYESLTDSLYHVLCLDGVRVLNQLNNAVPTTETGAVWIPKDTTDGATITRDEALAKIANGVEVYEGFPFDAIYTSVFPNVANGVVGNGQFDIKHVQGCGLRLMHSYGGEVIPVGADVAEPIRYFYNDPQNDHRAEFGGTGSAVTLHNHDTIIMALPGVNNRDGRVTVRQGEPYPFSVLSYEIDFETETGGPRR